MARVYATLTQYREYVGDESAHVSAALLTRASSLVDELLVGAVYDVDDDSLPTNPTVGDALTTATCAQVAWWAETGDTGGTGSTLGRLASASIGSVSFSVNAGDLDRQIKTSSGRDVAEGVVSALAVTGLWPINPYVYG